MSRPRIPTLAEYLSGSDPGDGFERFVAGLMQPQAGPDDPASRANARMLKTFAVALVEAFRIEEAAGRKPAETLPLACHLLGYCLSVSTLAAVDAAVPRLKVAREIGELFAAGAKRAARDQSRRREPAR